jgi:lipoyl(octanoyl) transferase|tara:strand:+ start:11 stop:622 length:612 start_codon:yes stop_codon:yes gene_type:complete
MEVKNSVKLVDYTKSMKILEKRVQDVFDNKKEELLWILEHKPVFTAGTSSVESDVLNKKIKILKTKRGGKHTFHGPGQKVVYFVINLNKRKKDIRELVKKIEICIIEILNEYKIEGYADRKNIGIWVDNKTSSKKIASIGIRVKKWVAYHGFSINVSNDLLYLNKIVPCGIKDKGVTSIKNLGIKKYKNINNIIVNKFLNIFL